MTDWAPLSSIYPLDTPRNDDAVTAPPVSPPPFATSAPGFDERAAVPDHAGFWQRFGAWVIDLVVLMIPSAIVFYATGGFAAYEHMLVQVQGNADMATAVREYAEATRGAGIGVTVIGFLYYALFEGSPLHATPGKLALRLRVTDMDGNGLSFGRSAARNAVRLVNIFTPIVPFFCYIPVAWTQRKQGLHDMLAHALVVNGRASDTVNVAASRATPRSGDGSFNA
jgi:uncharacterized RDD family membrane protein YckC